MQAAPPHRSQQPSVSGSPVSLHPGPPVCPGVVLRGHDVLRTHDAATRTVMAVMLSIQNSPLQVPIKQNDKHAGVRDCSDALRRRMDTVYGISWVLFPILGVRACETWGGTWRSSVLSDPNIGRTSSGGLLGPCGTSLIWSCDSILVIQTGSRNVGS